MKIKTAPTVVSILVYLIITGFYSTYGAASDNWSKIGFPYPFYIYTSGKIGNLGPRGLSNAGLNAGYLLLDLFFLIVLIFSFNYLALKFKTTKK